jgi:hypothetical protein
MELNGFNANEVEPNAPRDPIPAGWYKAVITESEEKPTKAQTGSYLQLTFEIVEGQHQGRKVFSRLNLNNPNATAVEIAQRELSGICRGVGVMTPRASQDLHDKPLSIKVKVTPARDGYEPGNEISEYAAANGGGSATTGQTASGGAKPPWKK